MALLGTRFTGHPPIEPFKVHITRDHALTRGLRRFSTLDELYLCDITADIETLMHSEFARRHLSTISPIRTFRRSRCRSCTFARSAKARSSIARSAIAAAIMTFARLPISGRPSNAAAGIIPSSWKSCAAAFDGGSPGKISTSVGRSAMICASRLSSTGSIIALVAAVDQAVDRHSLDRVLGQRERKVEGFAVLLPGGKELHREFVPAFAKLGLRRLEDPRQARIGASRDRELDKSGESRAKQLLPIGSDERSNVARRTGDGPAKCAQAAVEQLGDGRLHQRAAIFEMVEHRPARQAGFGRNLGRGRSGIAELDAGSGWSLRSGARGSGRFSTLDGSARLRRAILEGFSALAFVAPSAL